MRTAIAIATIIVLAFAATFAAFAFVAWDTNVENWGAGMRATMLWIGLVVSFPLIGLFLSKEHGVL